MNPFRLLAATIAAGILGGMIAIVVCRVPMAAADARTTWFWCVVGVGLALVAVMPKD